MYRFPAKNFFKKRISSESFVRMLIESINIRRKDIITALMKG